MARVVIIDLEGGEIHCSICLNAEEQRSGPCAETSCRTGPHYYHIRCLQNLGRSAVDYLLPGDLHGPSCPECGSILDLKTIESWTDSSEGAPVVKLPLSERMESARERHAKIREMNMRPEMDTDAMRRLKSKAKEMGSDNDRVMFTQKAIDKAENRDDLLFLPFTFFDAEDTFEHHIVAHKTDKVVDLGVAWINMLRHGCDKGIVWRLSPRIQIRNNSHCINGYGELS
jgi:hypothetical protein